MNLSTNDPCDVLSIKTRVQVSKSEVTKSLFISLRPLHPVVSLFCLVIFSVPMAAIDWQLQSTPLVINPPE